MTNSSVRRSPRLGPLVTFLLAIWVVSAAPATAASPTGAETLRATLDGTATSLDQMSSSYCHDLAYPTIRCFTSLAAMRDDEARMLDRPTTAATASGYTLWVTWYRDIGFGGPAYDAFWSWPDLSVLNWSHQVSSFRAYNGANPKWLLVANNQGVTVSWGVNAQVSYVGDTYNDRFEGVMVP